MLGAIDPNHDPLTTGQTAALGAFATLVGGLSAGLAGANALGGALAGQNEALNNTAKRWFVNKVVVPLVCLYCQLMGQETLPEVEPMPQAPPTEIIQKPPEKRD